MNVVMGPLTLTLRTPHIAIGGERHNKAGRPHGMRILRVHNRYQERGGEDVCFDAEVELLRDFGEDVSTLIVTNDDIPDKRSPLESIKLAASTVWSRFGYERVDAAIREHRPDVVHFDNTFPLLSPAAYTACRKHGVPVVQTLHNYRLLCPNAVLYRDGHTCEECLGKVAPIPAIKHACYRDSRAQTGAVAAMITAHRMRGTWSRDVDRYITMTAFERNKFIQGGFPADRIVIKPHFVRSGPPPPANAERSGLLYVGRLTEPKGLLTLIKAWQKVPAIRLTIVGDGPMTEETEAAARQYPLLDYVGRKSSDEILELMARAEMLVAPTQMYETFGRVAIEAFAQSTPVLAVNDGAIGEVVTDGVTGLHFRPGNVDDLSQRIRWAITHGAELREMGRNAREEYERRYTPETNYSELMDIYREVTNSSRGSRHISQPVTGDSIILEQNA